MFSPANVYNKASKTVVPALHKAGRDILVWIGSKLPPSDRKFVVKSLVPASLHEVKGPDEGPHDVPKLNGTSTDQIQSCVVPSPPDRNVSGFAGKLIQDYGYKQVYSMNISDLEKVPIWSKQRIFRRERAELIAKENKEFKGLPGIITLFSTSEASLNDGKSHPPTHLLDGQHRVGALSILHKSRKLNGLEDVLVEVFPVKNELDAKKLFQDINSAQPVKLIDLPEEADKFEREVINEASEKLKELFPDMFKVSQRCLPPHLNIDNLRDDLFQARVVSKNSLNSSEKLLQWLLLMNTELAQSGSKKAWSKLKKGKRWEQALEKASNLNFYLGLDKSWLYSEAGAGAAAVANKNANNNKQNNKQQIRSRSVLQQQT